jgi:hypothetical protein
MREYGSRALALVLVLGGWGASPALGQPDATLLTQWTAAAYWQPDVEQVVGKGSGGRFAVEAATQSSPPLPFVAMTPCRLIDTRGLTAPTPPYPLPAGYGSDNPLMAGSTADYQATKASHCTVPDGARAISVNVTLLGYTADGYLVAYPSDVARPYTATANWRTAVPPASGQYTQNAGVVALSNGGVIRVYATQFAKMVVDVNGYYGVAGTVTTSMNPNQVALKRWWEGNRSKYTITTASSRPSALEFDGTNIWVTNSMVSSVSKFRANDGAAAGGPYLVGGGPEGLAFDGIHIWTANEGSGSVSKIRAQDGVAAEGSPFAVGSLPVALAFDGTNVWVANLGSGTVTKLRASDGAEQPGSPFAVGLGPKALAFDGTNIWVANASSNSVSKLRASDGAEQPGSPFAVGTAPVALAFDGTNIWVANYAGNTVSKLRASDGAAQPGSPFVAGPGPAALAFDGTYIWVANRDGSSVSKLRASDGVQQPGSPFMVGSNPGALVFDGTNVWVANLGSGTIQKM